MIKNIFFGSVIFQMKKIEIFVYKCLKIDQNIIKSDIDNAQIHQHKHVGKNSSKLSISIS